MKIRKLVIVLGAAALLTACSQPSAPTTTPGSSGSAQAKDYHLGWYAPAPHPYLEEVRKGVEKFQAETGNTVDMQVGPDFNQSSENQGVEAMAAQGVKGFAIYPSDAAGANGLYQELDTQGVPVVNYGADSNRPNPAKFALVTDVQAAATQACEKLIDLMGGKGAILNVLEVLTDPNTALRKEAIEKCVSAHPGVTILQEVAGITTSDEAVSKIESALSANGAKIDGIITTGFNPSVGLAQLMPGYYAQNGSRHIKTVTIDTDPTVLKGIQDGVIDGTIGQNPQGQGYLSMKVLTLLLDGWKPAGGQTSIDTGDVFITKANLTTYSQDLEKVTSTISDELTTKYLTK
jgi:ribose transport system substrate-binding protein